VTADVTFNPNKGTTGTTKISNLEIADDKKNVVKDPGVTIVHDIGIATREEKGRKRQVITLNKTDLTASLGRGTVRGKVTMDDKGQQTVDAIVIDFKYSPDKLNTVLAPFMPGKKIEGAEEKTLKLTLNGRADAGDLLGILRGVRSDVDVDLAKFTMD